MGTPVGSRSCAVSNTQEVSVIIAAKHPGLTRMNAVAEQWWQ
jgi:hypothetical protein